MANWYGSARSNYFRVIDPDKFKKLMKELDVQVWKKKDNKGQIMFGLAPNDSSDGAWPTSLWDEENNEDIEISIPQIVAGHLTPGSIAVFMECGAEKLHYLTGWAVAINHKGKEVAISIHDIYRKAQEKFGFNNEVTEAEY